jgi:hypothetical protein
VSIYSYPSIYALGHKAIADIFKNPVLVEEKIDGSQFSMALIDGTLECRSKGQQIVVDAPEGMFAKAVATAKGLDLHPGYIYRCEYLEKPKHNTLAYSRVPIKHLIVYDVCVGLEQYMSYGDKCDEAKRLGLECVPVLHFGMVDNFEMFQSFLARESVLGGCTIEGVVIKNYVLFTMEKKIALGKYVSEAFKERNSKNWKEQNPTGKDVVQLLIETYRTDARWQKAVQHLREAGKLESSPRDIGLLIREIPDDILTEYGDEIKDHLFKHFWPQIKRGVTAGFPEWYKTELAKSTFQEAE